MPFAFRVGFFILAHLFVLVKYFFKLFFEALSNFLSRTRLCCFVSFAATLIFYQSLSGLSSTFFHLFLIPSPDRLDDSLTACISQAPLFLRFRRNSWYDTTVVQICQQLFSKFLKFFLRSQNFRVYYFYIYNLSNKKFTAFSFSVQRKKMKSKCYRSTGRKKTGHVTRIVSCPTQFTLL